MSTKNTSRSDLLHDFQSDLHALFYTLEQVGKYLKEDPNFCEEAIVLASKKKEKLFGQWEELKACLKKEEQSL